MAFSNPLAKPAWGSSPRLPHHLSSELRFFAPYAGTRIGLHLGCMRVQVKPSALISVAALAIPGRILLGGWSAALAFALLIVVCLLLHEAGHALVAHRHGIAVKAIGVSFIGAYTLRDKSPQRKAELLTAIAGPAVSSLLAIAFACLPGGVARLLALSNLVLAIANLLPIAPSDGWRMWKLLVP